MIKFPDGIDLRNTDEYVIKVKGPEIRIEKNKTFLEKASNLFGRYVYSDGWSYKTSKVKDVVDSEMQKIVKQKEWLANHGGKALEDGGQRSNVGSTESARLQKLTLLEHWVDDHSKSAKKREFSQISDDPQATRANSVGSAILSQQADSKDISQVSEAESAGRNESPVVEEAIVAVVPSQEKEVETPQTLYEKGLAFETGTETVKKDLEKADKYYLKAAEQGYAEAQYRLAELRGKQLLSLTSVYGSYGRNVPSDDEKMIGRPVDEDISRIPYYLKAVEYYVKAANQGNIDALYKLATLYKCTKPSKKITSKMGNFEPYNLSTQNAYNVHLRRHLMAAFPGNMRNVNQIADYYY